MGKLAARQWEAYTYARDNGHLKYVAKARQCEDFFAGLQWDERIRRKLVAEGKPVLTLNKTLSTVSTVLGEQLANRADIAFLPAKGGNAETSEALAAVFLQIGANNLLDWKESEVFADGIITSRGYYDVRLGFDDHMKGEVRIRVPNPVNVLPDVDADSYDPDDWKEVFLTKWFSFEDIELFYGKAKAAKLKGRDESSLPIGYDSIDQFQCSFGGAGRHDMNEMGARTDAKIRRKYRVIERQYRKLHNAPHFVEPTTGDLRQVPADWDRNKIAAMRERAGVEVIDRLTQQIRWTVTVDDVELFDDWSPYAHYTVVPYFPYFRRGNTLGVVEHLISTQEFYNKARSQMLHIINTTANSGWKVKAGSLRNMDIDDLAERGAETGLVLELNDIGDADKIQPNTVPTGLDRIAYEIGEDHKDISGVSDSQRGFDRSDVAAKATLAKQQMGSRNFAKPMDNLAQTRRLLARNILDIVQSHYTEERIIQITGGGLTDTSQDIVVNQTTPEGEIVNDLTLGEYSVRVTSVPHRDSLDQGAFEQVLEMRREGIAVPDHVLVELSNVPRKGEIAKAIKEANGGGEASPEQQAMAQLEVQAKQLENAKMQAEAEETQAKAQLATVRAQVEQAQAQGGGEGADLAALKKVEGELQLQAEKLQMERQKMEAELQMKREQMEAERDLQRQKYLMERAAQAERLDMERERMESQAELQRDQAAANAETQRFSAEAKAADAAKRTNTDREAKREAAVGGK